jgi:hypothetical protein
VFWPGFNPRYSRFGSAELWWVIGELLKREFVSLVSEVTTRLVREHHEVVAHGEAGIVPVAVLLDGTSMGGVPSGGSTACHGVVAGSN